MKRLVVPLFGCLLIVLLANVFVGCNRGSDAAGVGPTSTAAVVGPTAPGAEVRLSFQVEPTGAPELQPSVRGATGLPQVTVTLLSMNIGNTASPTTRQVQTAQIASGSHVDFIFTASTTTTIAQVSVVNGTIVGGSEFHGAADLVAGANVLVVNPVGSHLSRDVIASVLLQIVNDSSLFARAVPNLAGAVAQIVATANRQSTTVYADVMGLVNQQVLTGGSTGTNTGTAVNTAPVVSAPTNTPETLQNGDMTTSTVQSTKAGDIYFVKTAEPATTQVEINTAVSANKAFLGKANAVANTPYSVILAAGLTNGVYDLVAVDAVGNVSARLPGWLTLDNSPSGSDGSDVTIDEGGISSVYVRVPRRVLPDGTVVPSFLCGKYPATAGATNAGGPTYTNDGTYNISAATGQYQAATTAAGRPWVYLNWTDAKLACTQSGGALIGENQWLAIAHNALGVSANWRNGRGIGSTEASNGGFYRGLSSSIVSRGQPATGGDAGANPLNTSADYRVKTLTNGAQIWDIGGNVWQWIDQLQLAGKWYTGDSQDPGWIEMNLAGISNTNIKPGYDATYGVGRSYNFSTTSDRAFLRGAYYFSSDYAGAFALFLDWDPANSDRFLGFRCTRP